MTSNLSSYTEGLKKEAKARYLEKILLQMNGIDLFVKPAQGELFNGVLPLKDCGLASYLFCELVLLLWISLKPGKV